MIKKCVHIADIHIRTFQRHDEYREVFKTLLSDLTDLLKGYKREEIRIVIAGDVVHQKLTISNELTLMIAWLFTKLEEIAPLIIIAGNHDAVLTNKDRLDSITPVVKLLDKANINYFKDSKCYLDDNIVWCVYSVFEENKRPDIESARLEFGNDKTYIGLFHAPVMGSTTDMGFEVEHGASFEIFEGCDIVMLGDIHLRNTFFHKQAISVFSDKVSEYLEQKWVVESEDTLNDKVNLKKIIPISYPGSCLQQNFGESIKNHGFLLWDVKDRVFSEHNVDNPYLFYNIKISSFEDIENNKEKFTNI